MAGHQPNLRSLLKGLPEAPTFSLRWYLLTLSLFSVGFAIWGVVTGEALVVFGGAGAATVLLALALMAQHVAERSGAVERDRRREEEFQAELAGWPRWKQIAFLVVGVLLALGVLAFRAWSDSSSPG